MLAPWLSTRGSAASTGPRFALGVASGQPRPDGMVLWTRLTGEGLADRVAVRWEIAHDEAFARLVAHGVEVAEAAWAHSVHAEPAGLAPERSYWYRFIALGEVSAVGRTRTAPAPDAAATLDLVTASCQRYDAGHYAAWRQVARDDVDLVLFLGDYIYESASPRQALRRHEGGRAATLDQYRARYATYKSDPALQAAHAACPWLLVWDDHEVANDYAGLNGPASDAGFAAQRAAAYQAYWEHQPFQKALRPRGPKMRIVGRCDWGRLARIHLLDDRQYRDPQACSGAHGGSRVLTRTDCAELDDPARSLLGAEQERWLAGGWDLARPWNVVAQQTLMARFAAPGAEGGEPRVWTDGWDGYPAARRRLLGQVAERALGGVVVVGGDVHASYVADLKTDFGDPRGKVVATEFCGTSITSPSLAQARIDAIARFNPHVRHARADRRGYTRLRFGPERMHAELRVVEDVMDPASTVSTAARFAVDAGRPGVLVD
nr:alkaline phosphatase D family protein [Schlegelella koreensis]